MRNLFVLLITALLIAALLTSVTGAQYQYPSRPTPTRYSQYVPIATPARPQPTQRRPCIITESYYNCGGLVIGVSTPYVEPTIAPTP